MKNKFSEFYNLTQIEIDDLWANGIFVFDANVLLDLYRLSKNTSEAIFNILQKIKTNNQLWIPHQIGFEFHKDRERVIDIEKNEYERLSIYFSDKLPKEVEATLKENSFSHPFINSEKYSSQVKKLGNKISRSIKLLRKKHPEYEKSDNILDKLTELYEGSCVGEQFSESKLVEIFKEGNERYLKKIPPGFKDSQKNEPEKYGDLVLWYQLIEKSRESKKPIVFVTRDTKDDWWRFNNNGEKKGARRELIREMRDKAKTNFYLYEISYFINIASKKLDIQIDKKLTKEIKLVESIDVTDQLHVNVVEGYTNLAAENISPSLSGTVSSNLETLKDSLDISDNQKKVK